MKPLNFKAWTAAVAGLALYAAAIQATGALEHSDYGYTDATSVRVAAEMWASADSSTALYPPPLQGPAQPTDAELRTRHARDLGLLRAEEGPVGEDPMLAAPPTPSGAATSESSSDIPAETIPPIVTPIKSAWRPEDECSSIPNPGPVILTAATMGWCGAVARTLDWWDRNGGTWEAGELFHLLVSMECESNGLATAVNSSSGNWGLFQHRPSAWAQRSEWWVGIRDAPRTPTNDIIVGVALVNDPVRGQGFENAWDGCHAKQSVRDTLAAGGVAWTDHHPRG